jgi:hypothetical protein
VGDPHIFVTVFKCDTLSVRVGVDGNPVAVIKQNKSGLPR